MTQAAASAVRDLDVGHTVIDGVLAHLSVSSCEKAAPKHGGCYRRWNFDKVQGDKEPEKNASKVAKQKGTDMHERLAHYLRTGENILQNPEALGKHMLPEPGADLWVEQPFHRVIQPGNIVSSLYAAGVPFVGYIDFAHGRLRTWTEDEGHIIDPVGTFEVGDHKFKTNAKDRNGNSTLKLPGELVQTIQMAGYGKVVAKSQPSMQRVRLTHLYFPEKGDKPRKVTRLHVLEDCERTWEYVESVARTLKHVAAERDVNRVDGNVQACDSLGGCPYRDKCTKYQSTSIDTYFEKVAADFNKETTVGIIANNPNLMPQPMAPAPQMQTAPQPQYVQQEMPYDHRAQLAAEEAQMRAQHVQVAQAPQPPSLIEVCARLQALGRGMPKLAGAAAQAYAASGGQSIAPGSEYPGFGEFIGVTLADPAHVFAFAQQVLGQQPPPGVPAVPPAPVAPPTQNFTQQVAQAYNTQVPPTQQVQYPVQMTQAAPVNTQTAGGILAPGTPESQPQLAQQAPQAPQVPAGEAPKGKRGRPKKNDSGTAPEAAGSGQPAPAAAVQMTAPPSAVVSTPATPVQQPTSPVVEAPAKEQVVILINARSSSSSKSLAGYVDFLNATLAKRYCVDDQGQPAIQDIRCAPKGSNLAFGGWKGAVHECVRTNPPPLAGINHLDTHMDDLHEIIADALRVVAEQKGWQYFRGVR